MIYGEIKRGDTLKIIIQKKEFKGKTYIDSRQHFRQEDGSWMHMKKGIMIESNELSPFMDALEKAEKELTTGKE